MVTPVRKPRPPSASIPASLGDPTGTSSEERAAMREIKRKYAIVESEIDGILQAIPKRPVQTYANVALVGAARSYEYLLDASQYERIFDDIGIYLDEVLLESTIEGNWLAGDHISAAYRQGTSAAYSNLANQSAAYSVGRGSLGTLLLTDEYRHRLAILQSRVFEEMKGLSGDGRANLSRVLSDGLARGLNPRDVARNIHEQMGIEMSRANRIARTEITGALRRARWDEAEEAEELFGFRTMLLHLSAFSPTTRITHADRDSRLFTIEDVREWYSEDGNAINCKCSQSEVLVDESGNPLNSTVMDRAHRRAAKGRKRMEKGDDVDE